MSPVSPALAVGFFTTELLGKADLQLHMCRKPLILIHQRADKEKQDHRKLTKMKETVLPKVGSGCLPLNSQ